MTVPTLTLADFLLARIAEDEAVARAAIADLLVDAQDDVRRAWWITYDSMNLWPSHLTHIARHDPARVLADCDAKRRIVVRCQEMSTAAVPMAAHLAQQTLADLARPYADHPDFQDEWRP